MMPVINLGDIENDQVRRMISKAALQLDPKSVPSCTCGEGHGPAVALRYSESAGHVIVMQLVRADDPDWKRYVAQPDA